MRLIDADALVYKLTEMVRYNTGEYKNGIAAARLVTMDAPTVGGWISVEDRLPDTPEKWVLASLIDNNTGHRWECPVMAEYVKKYNKWVTDGGFENVTVTHWMPRPEPPEEVCNNED